ncbi:MAG: hypothetical protein MZU79_00840 [Anaerotruncus sp.]|nr:hypothetical protein [Anaerotruncus sp.]
MKAPSGTRRAAPASARMRALSVCWSYATLGDGTRIAGRPPAVSSCVAPPAPPTTRSAAA